MDTKILAVSLGSMMMLLIAGIAVADKVKINNTTKIPVLGKEFTLFCKIEGFKDSAAWIIDEKKRIDCPYKGDCSTTDDGFFRYATNKSGITMTIHKLQKQNKEEIECEYREERRSYSLEDALQDAIDPETWCKVKKIDDLFVCQSICTRFTRGEIRSVTWNFVSNNDTTGKLWTGPSSPTENCFVNDVVFNGNISILDPRINETGVLGCEIQFKDGTDIKCQTLHASFFDVPKEEDKEKVFFEILRVVVAGFGIIFVILPTALTIVYVEYERRKEKRKNI